MLTDPRSGAVTSATVSHRPAAPPAAAPTGSGQDAPRVDRPAASAALAFLTMCSAAGLFRVFSGAAWVGPVLVTIVAVHGLCWFLRRRRAPGGLAAVVCVVAIVLLAAWTILGHYTVYGFVTTDTWNHALSALRDLSTEFASTVAPVTPTKGFELLAVGGAGVAAAGADFLAFRTRLPLAAVIPGMAIFIYCCTAGQPKGRPAVVAAEVAGICLFLLVERATNSGHQVWFAGVRPGAGPGLTTAGLVLSAAAIAAAVAMTPALAPHDGTGALGWRNGFGAGGGERIVPNPLVDLRTELTKYANIPAFLVSSSAPSYWRLTSLDDFNGITWTSTGSYRGFGKALPQSVPTSGVRTARAAFTIQGLDSPWLPAQFSPVSVTGVRGITYDPTSGSLLTRSTTPSGLNYLVTSYQFLDTLTAAGLARAPSVSNLGSVAVDTQLPSNLNPAIYALANTLSAGVPTEYGRAIAIQTYLRSSKFKYSLNPVTDGSGLDALQTFLFSTRQGYCQQFAGAFAVLARAAGLPTRVAVGFVTGQPTPGGEFQVRDRDAHTWPEVYFGPQYGWVPFEPTPGFSVPGTSGYSQPTGPANPDGPGPSTTPTTVPTGSATTEPSNIQKPTITSSPTSSGSGLPVHQSGGSGGISPLLLIIPGVAVAWLLVNGFGPALMRVVRRRRAWAAGPAAVVANAWGDVGQELARQGLPRRPDETDDEFAARATDGLRAAGHGDAGRPWQHGGLQALAAMARAAAFAPAVPGGLAPAAEAAATEIRSRLARALDWRQRLQRISTPPPGLWEAVGRALRPRRPSRRPDYPLAAAIPSPPPSGRIGR
jgi:transglutaminase-like putative cysteine protease